MFFGCSSCCECTPTGSYITLDAGQRVVRSLAEGNNTYDFEFPPVLNHAWASVPAQVACRWACDQNGDEPSVEVVISRIVENTEGGPVKSLMWDAKVSQDPYGFQPGITEWPISYRYEIELKKGIKDGSGYRSESVSRVMVPTLPANNVNNRFGIFGEEGSKTLPRTFSHWATYCRVTNRRVQGKWLVCVLLGVADIRASETFTSPSSAQGIPHLTQPVYLEIYNPSSATNLPQGVRHIFDDLEVEKFGDYTSIVSDVTMFSDWDQPYPNRGTYYSSRPLHCMLIQSGVKQQVENALPTPSIECNDPSQEYRHVQLNVCDYRKRRGHVTHSQDGKSFTKLKVGFQYPEWTEPITLEVIGEDNAALCDGTFWWAGDLPVGDGGASVRVEAAASLMTNPHLSCFTSGPFKKQISTLSFSSCHGSGASGTVDAPGQASQDSDPIEDAGPITAVSLTDGGSGYAKLGRAAPTVTVAGTSGSGTGATFNVTLASSQDSCGLDRWAVSKVTMTGGTDYKAGDTLTFAVAEGDTQEEGASGTIYTARVTPTVTVSGTSGSGTGATFNVTLAQSQDSQGRDRWAVSKVTQTGGSGYQNGDTLTFAVAEGDTQEVAAQASIAVNYSEPTLTATVAGGTGGVLSINGYTKLVGGPPFGGYYVPTGITVTSGGTGYTNNSTVTLSLGANDEWAPSSGAPDIKIRTKIDPPGGDWTLTAYSADGMELSAGVGLALSITLTPVQGVDGWFEPVAVTITNGGTGYQVGELIIATVPPDEDFGETALVVTSVGQDGAVTGLSIDYPGQHEGVDTGVISSVAISSNRASRKAITENVNVSNGGVYYREDGNNRTVTVNSGGLYYREDASLPPYVATVTVGIDQTAPSQGSGASISATVGSDPANAETFGKITGLTINSGGTGYIGYLLDATSPSWPTLVGLSFRVNGNLYWHKCKFVGASFFPDNPGVSDGLKLLRGQEVVLEFDDPTTWVRIDEAIPGTANRYYSRPNAPITRVTLQLLPDE